MRERIETVIRQNPICLCWFLLSKKQFGHLDIHPCGSLCRNRRSDSFWLLIGQKARPRPASVAHGLPSPWLVFLHISHRMFSQSAPFVLLTLSPTHSPAIVLQSKMSATSVFPMCVRASRSLLRLRVARTGLSSQAQTDAVVRTLSTDKPSAGAGGGTGGLAQAILQERLQQQQQQSQVK